MKEQVSFLIELQKIDDRMRREAVKKTELPERIRILKEEIRQREARVAEKQDMAESSSGASRKMKTSSNDWVKRTGR